MIRRRWQVRQRPTHTGLLGRATAPDAISQANGVLDAIIVPTARSADNLEHAITLARDAKTHLVLLCSRDADPGEVLKRLDSDESTAATVVKIPDGYTHDLFEFDTTLWVKNKLPGMCAVRHSDLSVKRNIGLVVARMLDWKRIFFMDDDIRDVTPTALLHTVSALGGDGGCRSVGMAVTGFPDNSVVCHARRETKRYQGVFVSGSVLAVDTKASFDFFPDIYNEDWLFFYRDTAKGRLGSSGRTATQLPYDPFASPQRAAGQEFGDVIAEGLYALLDEDLGSEYATAEYWNQFLADRKRILDEIIEKSDTAPQDIREKMTQAVSTARMCLGEIQPDMCVDYVLRWRRDLGQWETTLKQLPKAASISAALGKLNLAPAAAEDAMS